MAKKPSVPIDGTFEPAAPDNRIWQEKLRDGGNDWINYLLGPHAQTAADAVSLLPSQSLVDILTGSGTISKGIENRNPWEAGMGIAGLLGGFLPGKSNLEEFPLIHGTRHDFAPTADNALGKFDLGKVLTGEGTNYEGKGIYATDPKAKGLGTSYAHTGVDDDLLIMLGDKRSSDILKELKDKEGSPGANTADMLDALFKLEEMAVFNNSSSKLTFTDDHIDKILESMSEQDPTTGLLWAPPENTVNFLNSFRGKEATIKEPGGYIYDFTVKDSPDNFINMHLPLQYQDDKIIKGVDEWFKNMPIDDKIAQAADMKTWLEKGRSANHDDIVEHLRRKFIDDEYKIPKEDMSRILQNQFMNEHMDILKDQGILGQKWFGRHAQGGRHRDSVTQLFSDLKTVDEKGVEGLDMTRSQLQDKINGLEDKMNTTPLSDTNIPFMHLTQAKINELTRKLMNMDGPDDIAEKLWAIYNDPNLAYNYTINNPEKTVITKKTFIPK